MLKIKDIEKYIDDPLLDSIFREREEELYIECTNGFMLCSEKNPLRICKHCGKVFYAKNPKAEYDSSQCRNQANVYKSRNKNKAD